MTQQYYDILYSPNEPHIFTIAANPTDPNYNNVRLLRLDPGCHRLQLVEHPSDPSYQAWQRKNEPNNWSNIFRTFIPGVVDDVNSPQAIEEFGNRLDAATSDEALAAWPEEGAVLEINAQMSQVVMFYIYSQIWREASGGLTIKITPM